MANEQDPLEEKAGSGGQGSALVAQGATKTKPVAVSLDNFSLAAQDGIRANLSRASAQAALNVINELLERSSLQYESIRQFLGKDATGTQLERVKIEADAIYRFLKAAKDEVIKSGGQDGGDASREGPGGGG